MFIKQLTSSRLFGGASVTVGLSSLGRPPTSTRIQVLAALHDGWRAFTNDCPVATLFLSDRQCRSHDDAIEPDVERLRCAEFGHRVENYCARFLCCVFRQPVIAQDRKSDPIRLRPNGSYEGGNFSVRRLTKERERITPKPRARPRGALRDHHISIERLPKQKCWRAVAGGGGLVAHQNGGVGVTARPIGLQSGSRKVHSRLPLT
jgi:hypothetical protein